MSSASEKTEQPTPRKLRDAKKKGRVFVSKDLTMIISLAIGCMAIFFMLKNASKKLIIFSGNTFHETGMHDFDYQYFSHLMREMLYLILWLSVPVALIVCASLILILCVQTGFVFSGEMIKPQLTRLNLIEGFKRIYSVKSFFEFIKSFSKFLACMMIFYFAMKGSIKLLVLSVNTELNQIPVIMRTIGVQIILQVIVFFCIVAAADYCFQRWHYKKQLKMTRQELKQEYREEEGDPHIKVRRRQLHEEFALNAMLLETKHADVVIVNPKEVAVAIKYDAKIMKAPVVVAKGEGFIAKKIRETAEQYNIAMLENVPLAHALIKVKTGNEIPEELYETVAEVLNFVYQLAKKKSE